MKRYIFAILYLLCTPPVYAQNQWDTPIAYTEEVMNEILSREDIVGASITIGHDDTILFSKGYGLADRELNVITQDYHKFRIYSLSKHITAIAAAKLFEDSLLDLDRPIVDYIPFLDEKLHAVTTRQLIGHVSGVRSYQDEEWQKVSNGVCQTPFESILSFQSDSLLFTPGDEFSYTSFGYVLLSAVIEKVAEMPFMDYLTKVFFEPLQLNITLDNAEIIDNLAVKPYEYWQETMYNARYANNTCKFGGGGFSSSTQDVVRFNQALLRNKLIQENTLNMVFTSLVLNNGEKTSYGFGLQFDIDDAGRSYAWHSGRSRGGRNALVIYPKEKLVVCISSNTNGEGIVVEAENIARYFLNNRR